MILLFFGLVFLGAAAVFSIPSQLDGTGPTERVPVQTACGGVGLLLLFAGVARFFRPEPVYLLKRFLFADCNYFWDVNPDAVSFTRTHAEGRAACTKVNAAPGHPRLFLLGQRRFPSSSFRPSSSSSSRG